MSKTTAVPTPAAPPGASLANPIAIKKWQAQRNAERITLQDHKTLPHINSTMRDRYDGRELRYRGRA